MDDGSLDIFVWLKAEVKLMADEEIARMQLEYWGDWSKPAKFTGLGSWIKGEKTMDNNVTKLLLTRRKMELIVHQLNLARWGRLLQEVKGSIHGFANEEDEAFLKHQIESAETNIRSLEAEIEKLENPPASPPLVCFRIRSGEGLEGRATPMIYRVEQLLDAEMLASFNRQMHAGGPHLLEYAVDGGEFQVLGELR